MRIGRTLATAVLMVGLLAEPAAAQPRKAGKPRFAHKMLSHSAALAATQKLQIKTKIALVDPQVLDCNIDVPVRFQRKTKDGWKTIASDRTNDNGVAKVVVADKTGRYRAVAPATLSEETGYDCFKAVSEVARHSH